MDQQLTSLLSRTSLQELLLAGQRVAIARLRDVFAQHAAPAARAENERLRLSLLASRDMQGRLEREQALLATLSEHYYAITVEQQQTVEELRARVLELTREAEAREDGMEAARAAWAAEAEARCAEARAEAEAATRRETETRAAAESVVRRLESLVGRLTSENEQLLRQLQRPALSLGLLASGGAAAPGEHGDGARALAALERAGHATPRAHAALGSARGSRAGSGHGGGRPVAAAATGPADPVLPKLPLRSQGHAPARASARAASVSALLSASHRDVTTTPARAPAAGRPSSPGWCPGARDALVARVHTPVGYNHVKRAAAPASETMLRRHLSLLPAGRVHGGGGLQVVHRAMRVLLRRLQPPGQPHAHARGGTRPGSHQSHSRSYDASPSPSPSPSAGGGYGSRAASANASARLPWSAASTPVPAASGVPASASAPGPPAVSVSLPPSVASPPEGSPGAALPGSPGGQAAAGRRTRLEGIRE
jgi:hypothetical protein